MTMKRGYQYKVSGTDYTIEMISTGYAVKLDGELIGERSTKKLALSLVSRMIGR